MTIHVNQQEAANDFPKLLSQVLEGEEIVISIDGEEIAKILPYKSQKNKQHNHDYRKPGLLKGKLSESFFEPLPKEELKLWEQDI